MMGWLAGVQLNSIFLFSPRQAMSESKVFERIQHYLRYMFQISELKATHRTSQGVEGVKEEVIAQLDPITPKHL